MEYFIFLFIGVLAIFTKFHNGFFVKNMLMVRENYLNETRKNILMKMGKIY